MKSSDSFFGRLIGAVMSIYLVGAIFSSFYFYYRDVKENDSFLRSIFISPVVGVLKSVVWPYYAFHSSEKIWVIASFDRNGLPIQMSFSNDEKNPSLDECKEWLKSAEAKRFLIEQAHAIEPTRFRGAIYIGSQCISSVGDPLKRAASSNQ